MIYILMFTVHTVQAVGLKWETQNMDVFYISIVNILLLFILRVITKLIWDIERAFATFIVSSVHA